MIGLLFKQKQNHIAMIWTPSFKIKLEDGLSGFLLLEMISLSHNLHMPCPQQALTQQTHLNRN